MPLSRTRSTRFTLTTGSSEPLAACQTKASAEAKSGFAAARGAIRSNAATIFATLAASSGERAGESGGIWALLSGRSSAGKGRAVHCAAAAICCFRGLHRYSPRHFCGTFCRSASLGKLNVLRQSGLRPGCHARRRRYRHAAGAVRHHPGHHVFPHPAAAAETGQEPAGTVKNVRRGDTVITTGGIIGKVTKSVDDSEVEIEIAPNVRVRLLRAMISDVRAKGEPVKEAS